MRTSRLRLFAAAGLGLAAVALAAPARANVLISIDKTAQSMTVTVDGDPRYVWPVSTGLARYNTPNGQYTPSSMKRHHYSREWDWAPMPYSIFFTNQGHAIHGSNATRKLGQPASHGCVRLSPAHAATLFALVREQGLENTQVELAGRLPTRQELMAKLKGTDDDANDAREQAEQVAELPQDLRDGDLRENDLRDDELPRDLAAAPGFRAYRENGRTYYIRVNPRVVRRVYRVIRQFHFRW